MEKMKNSNNGNKIILVIAGILFLLGIGAFTYGILNHNSGMNPDRLTLVKAGEENGKKAESVDIGKIVCTAEASNNVAGYQASFAVDGDIESYWEGAGEYPEYFVLTAEREITIRKMILSLNPASVWGKRTQVFSIETSDDGENYIEILPATEYVFDYNEGNQVEIAFTDEGCTGKYFRFVFTGNDSAGGGQLAEISLYE